MLTATNLLLRCAVTVIAHVRTLAKALAAAVITVLAPASVSACTTARPNGGSIAGTLQTHQGGGSTCANCLRPLRARLWFIARGGAPIWAAKSGIRGRFYIVLPTGVYVVKVVMPPCDATRNVQVRANATLRLRLICPNAIG